MNFYLFAPIRIWSLRFLVSSVILRLFFFFFFLRYFFFHVNNDCPTCVSGVFNAVCIILVSRLFFNIYLQITAVRKKSAVFFCERQL